MLQRKSRQDRDDAGGPDLLGILRAYLIGMTLMLGYHVLDLAGVFHAIR